MLVKKINRNILATCVCLELIICCNPQGNQTAEQNKDVANADVFLNKGIVFLDEDTETPHYDSAIIYLEKASLLGNIKANGILAEQYFLGQKIKADTNKAKEYVQMAIEKGDSSIYNVLAKFYYSSNIDKAIEYLKKGDSKYSSYELSQLLLSGYAFGQPTPVHKDKINEQEGLKYLMKSAENGNLQAQQSLSYYYLKGLDNFLKPDTTKAKYYYDKALNNPEAKEIPGAMDELEELGKSFK